VALLTQYNATLLITTGNTTEVDYIKRNTLQWVTQYCTTAPGLGISFYDTLCHLAFRLTGPIGFTNVEHADMV
jgi:hypothetical protein